MYEILGRYESWSESHGFDQTECHEGSWYSLLSNFRHVLSCSQLPPDDMQPIIMAGLGTG